MTTRDKPTRLADALRKAYDPKIQLSTTQIEAIAGAILSRQPGCNLLVFGCGHDSALWNTLNAEGYTLFIEGSPEWAQRAREADSSLRIESVDFSGISVESSLKNPMALLSSVEVPAFMKERTWDVIIIDGPQGHKARAPGRALPILWSAAVRTPSTHVFVDDYERELEQTYADLLLRRAGAGSTTIARRPAKPQLLFWSVGESEAFGTGEAGPVVEVEPLKLSGPASERRDKTALLFLLDRNYLDGLKTLLYTLRDAVPPNRFDIIVITNDAFLRESKFVQAVARELVVLDDNQLGRFASVRSQKVSKSLRIEGVGKYTFLKFLAYSDLGYASHIFLDTDMIALDPGLQLTELIGEYDFAAAPTLGPARLRIENEKVVDQLSDEQRRAIFDHLLSLTDKQYKVSQPFNSGAMFVGGKLLNERTVNGLLKLASEEAFALEQNATREYISTRVKDLRFRSLPLWYNFVSLPAYAIGQERFEQIRGQIKILHYNRQKPWTVAPGDADWLQQIWHEQHAQARAWAQTIE
jgi:lipopolysaccharide biosynthesis glycosyltransferase